jgi:hypothetical protein
LNNIHGITWMIWLARSFTTNRGRKFVAKSPKRIFEWHGIWARHSICAPLGST